MSLPLFFVSGAAALMWSRRTRYLGLLVGHDAYAQVVVLTISWADVRPGAWFVSRRTASIARPLRAYALIEAVVGIIGLLLPRRLHLRAGMAYDSSFPSLSGSARSNPRSGRSQGSSSSRNRSCSAPPFR